MDNPREHPASRKVLIIDDEDGVRGLCRRIVSSADMEPIEASDGEEGLRALGDILPDYVLLDINLPGRNGMEILKEVRRRFPRTRVVMITGYAEVDRAVTAMKLGAHDYITKPFSPDRLRSVLRDGAPTDAAPPRPAPARSFCRLVGVSSAMQRIYELIDRSARTDSTVLIEGESGTGKELVARAIHARSRRADEPFVPVNCGAIPPALIESELFGHVAGAFTDARRPAPGLLRSAEGGSVFLDEIGELGRDVQVKLLRALQEMEVRPVGSAESVPYRARILAATNRDLSREAEEGRFRRDLFYRLHVVPIFLPPLRERREDIPLLVEHFLRLHGARAGREMGVSVPALSFFMRHDWPGNVRELENAIQRAYALLDGDMIEEGDLEILFPKKPAGPDLAPPGEPKHGRLLEQTEARTIRQALADAGGNKREAARCLGIGIATLYRKVKRYGIT